MGTYNVTLSNKGLPMGILWSMQYPKNVNLAVDGLVCFANMKKN